MSPTNRPKAAIVGCSGLTLTEAEKAFFSQSDPLGFILFARNVETPAQVKALVADLRACVGRADAPVLIDQEGGRVQRLRAPHWTDLPPAALIGKIAQRDFATGQRAARLHARLIAAELSALGIDVDCAPVVDVPVPGAHDIIGDRAYAQSPDIVGLLTREAARGFIDGGVLPVIKHIPGHGRAYADSHLELPTVDTTYTVLEKTDFEAFRFVKDAPWGMTAHILYTDIDPDRPATLSHRVVRDVIRGEIGFDGLLLTDDLSMKALTGSFEEKTERALEAGCDVVLHCNGDMEEMKAVMAVCPAMSDAAWHRFETGRRYLSGQARFPEIAR